MGRERIQLLLQSGRARKQSIHSCSADIKGVTLSIPELCDLPGIRRFAHGPTRH